MGGVTLLGDSTADGRTASRRPLAVWHDGDARYAAGGGSTHRNLDSLEPTESQLKDGTYYGCRLAAPCAS